MNLILLLPEDFEGDGLHANVSGRRGEHILRVHRATPGKILRVGALDGPIGQGEVVGVRQGEVRLRTTLTGTPPPDAGVHLVLALPRPKVLGRVLRDVATLGVKRLTLMNASRVEKSYWQNHRLQPTWLREQLVLGLEQARDTLLPRVDIERRFRPFVEDRLAVSQGARAGRLLVLHPASSDARAGEANQAGSPRLRGGEARRDHDQRDASNFITVVVGPEGGFIPFELEMLEQIGGRRLDLGARILRVETVIPLALGRLRS